MARPPSEVSLYLKFMSRAVSHIVLMTPSRETFAKSGVLCKAKLGSSDRFDRPHRISFDTGDLDQPTDRVTGHSKVMLHRNFGGHQRLALTSARGFR